MMRRWSGEFLAALLLVLTQVAPPSRAQPEAKHQRECFASFEDSVHDESIGWHGVIARHSPVNGGELLEREFIHRVTDSVEQSAKDILEFVFDEHSHAALSVAALEEFLRGAQGRFRTGSTARADASGVGFSAKEFYYCQTARAASQGLAHADSSEVRSIFIECWRVYRRPVPRRWTHQAACALRARCMLHVCTNRRMIARSASKCHPSSRWNSASATSNVRTERKTADTYAHQSVAETRTVPRAFRVPCRRCLC